MALSKEQVGLIFKLDADTASAKRDMEVFQEFMKGLAQGMEKEFQAWAKKIEAHYKSVSDAAKKTEKDFTSFRASIDSVTTSIGGVNLAIGGLVAVVAGLGLGFLKIAKHTSDLGDQIDDLRQSTSLSAETLSGLNIAAQQEEKTLDSLNGALTRFNVTVSKAQSGNKELQSIFKQLGVDLSGSTDAIFRQTIDRFKDMEAGANKTAVGVQLFGRGVGELIPILNDMEGGIDGAIAKAKELGIFFTDEGAASAAEYKNQIKLLNQQLEGREITIGKAVIPAFSGFTVLIRQSVEVIKGATRSLHDYVEQMEKLGVLTAIFLSGGNLAAITGGGGGGGTPTGDVDLSRTGSGGRGRAKTPKELKEFFSEKDFAKLQDRLGKEELDREIALNKLREDAEREHLKAMEELRELDFEQEIDRQRRLAEQGIISEEEAAQKIGALRLASFQARENELNEELQSVRTRLDAINGLIEDEGPTQILLDQREELLKEEQKFVDAMLVLIGKRAKAEKDGVDEIIKARERDLQNLINKTNEIKRLQKEIDEGLKTREDDSIMGGLFGPRFTDAIRRTGSELAGFQSMFAGFASSIHEKLAEMPSLAETAFHSFADGLASIAEQFAVLGTTGPAVMRQLAAAVILNVAKMAAIKGAYMIAEGFALLASFQFAAAAHAFLSGALFLAIGAGLGFAGRAIAPSSGAPPAGGAGSTQSGPRIIDQSNPIPGQRPQVIIIHARQAPGVVVDIVHEDYNNNGKLRSTIRRDTLND